MKKPTARDYSLVDSLVNSPCNPDLCGSLNHTKRDQHGYSSDCPVIARVRAAWARIVAAQARPAPKDEDEDAGPVYCCSQHPEHENVRCQIPLGHDGEHQWAGYDKGCRWGGGPKQREVEK